MKNQKDKYHLAMAGEYLIAAYLHRIGINASITYGNAKRADVIAFSGDNDKSVFIEVKTSAKGRWPVGSKVPEPSPKLWIFVLLPAGFQYPASFFIMTQEEIHDTLIEKEIKYLERYKLKHGRDYGDKPGVACMTLEIAKDYKDKWETITNLLD